MGVKIKQGISNTDLVQARQTMLFSGTIAGGLAEDDACVFLETGSNALEKTPDVGGNITITENTNQYRIKQVINGTGSLRLSLNRVDFVLYLATTTSTTFKLVLFEATSYGNGTTITLSPSEESDNFTIASGISKGTFNITKGLNSNNSLFTIGMLNTGTGQLGGAGNNAMQMTLT